jgi:FkbM family methyltransferase
VSPDLPFRLRFQFALVQRLTAVLRVLGIREPVILARCALRRAVRRRFEQHGSTRLSHPALHSMDLKLDAIIDRDGGFFIEAGGNDGYTQSNTYYLERFRNWRGMLVEPMPELAAEARRNRPGATVFQCALVDRDFPDEHVEMEFGELMSSVRGTNDPDFVNAGLVLGWRDRRVERVRARPLSDLLTELGDPEVDLLSLDVEGFEPTVLAGLDLSRHAPAWILIEMHDLDAGRAAIEPLLGSRYVEHAELSPLDVLYRRVDVSAGA